MGAHSAAMIDSRLRLQKRDGGPSALRRATSTLAGVDDIASVFEDVPGAGRARVLVAGEGHEPLLFVHGWPACARVFWPLLTAPGLRARFRMLAPDLFGFGRSTLRAPRLTFAHEVDAVLAVARRAGAPCLAVGTSFGARVLLEAVTEAPALFRRVVLLAPYLHRGLIESSVAGADARPVSAPAAGAASPALVAGDRPVGRRRQPDRERRVGVVGAPGDPADRGRRPHARRDGGSRRRAARRAPAAARAARPARALVRRPRSAARHARALRAGAAARPDRRARRRRRARAARFARARAGRGAARDGGGGGGGGAAAHR